MTKIIVEFGGLMRKHSDYLNVMANELLAQYPFQVECIVKGNVLTIISKSKEIEKQFSGSIKAKFKILALKGVGISIKTIKE